MNAHPAVTFRRRPAARLHRHQQGVVLFVALIAMIVLSLAGVALVRSVDTGAGVTGNIAFRTASVVAVNYAVEDAVYNLFKAPLPINPDSDNPARHYYSFLQASEKSDGTPNVLAGTYPPAGYSMSVWQDPTTNVEVRYVIERVCTAAAKDKSPTIGTCDLLPPKVSPAGTDNEVKRIPLPSIPHYRVTVRVDLPNTNTTTIAQAFLR